MLYMYLIATFFSIFVHLKEAINILTDFKMYGVVNENFIKVIIIKRLMYMGGLCLTFPW